MFGQATVYIRPPCSSAEFKFSYTSVRQHFKRKKFSSFVHSCTPESFTPTPFKMLKSLALLVATTVGMLSFVQALAVPDDAPTVVVPVGLKQTALVWRVFRADHSYHYANLCHFSSSITMPIPPFPSLASQSM